MSVVDGSKRQRIIDALIDRDGPDCFYCGQIFGTNCHSTSLTLDHHIPKRFGGKANVENLRLACYTCNIEKSCMPVEEFLASEWLRNKREWVVKDRLREIGIRPDGKGFWHPKKSIKKISKPKAKIRLICTECHTVSSVEFPLWCFPCKSGKMLVAG